MISCKSVSGISNVCINNVGGLDRTFWLFYKSDLNTQISLLQTSDVSNINFGVYTGFIRFDGQKFSHQYTSSLIVSGVGNRSYTPNVIIRILSGSTYNDVLLQKLSLAQDIIVLVQDNNRQFYIIGAGNGLYVTNDEQTSGQLGDADTSDVITMIGGEVTKPLRFNIGTYQSTLDYILAHEIVVVTPVPPVDDWVLIGGVWNDSGHWNDSDTWID